MDHTTKMPTAVFYAWKSVPDLKDPKYTKMAKEPVPSVECKTVHAWFIFTLNMEAVFSTEMLALSDHKTMS
jgi:hypothetical protein